MTRTHMGIVAVVFGAAFALSSVLRDAVAPGLVGGALGGLLVYLVLQRAHAHNERIRRRRERDG